MYIYESHMGSLYVSDTELDYDYLYCEQCGDLDRFIGYATNKEEAWNLLKDETDTFDKSICDDCPHNEDYNYCNNKCEYFQCSGGWNYDYVQEFINEYWSK